MGILKNRYEIMALVEASMCNPNGDPDMANRPRVDFETGRGIITDVAFKSRIRNYVLDAYACKAGYDILMRSGNNINMSIAEAALAVNNADSVKDNKMVAESAAFMCEKYWDVRTFGSVLSTGLNAGQVRGATQVGMAMSIDPVDPEVITITRKCYADGKFATLDEYVDADAKMADDKKRTMGSKTYIPYGLYVLKMTVSANLAEKVGFTEEDLSVLLESIVQMYNNDISSSKMGMSVITPVLVFKHVGTDLNNPEQNRKECLLGCTPSYKLFDLLNIEKAVDTSARSITDYNISVNLDKLPNGVEFGVKKSPYSDVEWISTRTVSDLFLL